MALYRLMNHGIIARLRRPIRQGKEALSFTLSLRAAESSLFDPKYQSFLDRSKPYDPLRPKLTSGRNWGGVNHLLQRSSRSRKK